MYKKISLKLLIGIYIVLTLLLRVFYFQVGNLFGVRFSDYALIVILVLTIILLIIAIIKAFRKKFKPLLILIITVVAIYCMPFEFVFGWIGFRFNSKYRNGIIAELNEGKFDSILSREGFPQSGAWIEKTNPRFKVYKRGQLKMIFIYQGDIGSGGDEFCGALYFSDLSYPAGAANGFFIFLTNIT